jgi:PadR family transcriptional regulator PadR
MTRGNPSFLNGVPELLVLSLLAQREMYGYELVQSIRAKSGEAFRFGEGCIYPYLHYLEEIKLVRSRRTERDGRSRVYYRLTLKGKKRLASLTEEWRRVAKGVELILGGAHA